MQQLAPVIALVGLVYAIAILIKVAIVRSRGEPYQFRQWDGGLMLRGKSLGTKGTLAFAAAMAGLGAVVAYLVFVGPLR